MTSDQERQASIIRATLRLAGWRLRLVLLFVLLLTPASARAH